ncbi:MAG: hypothetical protein ACJAVV_001264 [Alphaproteobacteria bacterium]|jgi:hypothetical protein
MILKRIATGIFLAVMLSGCTLLEDGHYILTDSDNPVSSQLTQLEAINSQSSQIKPADSPMLELIARQQVLDNTKRIDQLIVERADMVKNVNRVIELDAELSYLMSELKNADALNSLSSETFALNEYSSQGSSSVTAANDYTSPEITRWAENKEPMLVADTNAQALPIAGKAKPIISDLGVQDNKFANTADSTNQNLASQSIKSDAGDKFSSPVLSKPSIGPDKLGENTNLGMQCAHNAVTNTSADGVGIHLISVKNQNSLSGAADSLMSKFPNELCETTAKIESVSVKGESYYSLRFGPYVDREYALSICSKLKTKGQYCGLAKFSGRTL